MFMISYLTVIALAIGWTTIEADEVPAFFLKIAKNIPRVGRSGRSDDFFLEASKNIPRTADRDGYIPVFDINPNGVSWENFPLAIEGPPELWRALASYTNDKYGTSSDEINNEIWRRDKRKDSDAMQF
ncbi:hypothetical protein PV325_014013 [Microctonus aethiopoides]|uniref:Uncharacterized protein n=1 Tax=Microctonus aethiopoides TaxID=144406 RepID=A0AA39EZN4_9HYME|nr:hypothetical protein PV325_014013 [Microctonus aethiopoides]KAK0092143.1 hypothetical protein PV326_002099 [Microctonus aethiopoides]KAK0158761.1 hypothetical protein PV328_009717 [Microctonus aethiopoides]